MSGRDSKGQFTIGNPGGPGRPSRQTEAAYLCELKTICSPEVWREILVKVVDDAKHGNTKAVQFLSRYLLADAPSLLELAVWEEVGYDPIDGKIHEYTLKKSLGM